MVDLRPEAMIGAKTFVVGRLRSAKNVMNRATKKLAL